MYLELTTWKWVCPVCAKWGTHHEGREYQLLASREEVLGTEIGPLNRLMTERTKAAKKVVAKALKAAQKATAALGG